MSREKRNLPTSSLPSPAPSFLVEGREQNAVNENFFDGNYFFFTRIKAFSLINEAEMAEASSGRNNYGKERTRGRRRRSR